jgi:hypothetical protein
MSSASIGKEGQEWVIRERYSDTDVVELFRGNWPDAKNFYDTLVTTPPDARAAKEDARRMSLYEFHFIGRSIFELMAEAEVAHGESVMLVNNELLIEAFAALHAQDMARCVKVVRRLEDLTTKASP